MVEADLSLLKSSVDQIVVIEALNGELFLARPLVIQEDAFDGDEPNLIYDFGELSQSGEFVVQKCCYMLLENISRVARKE